MSSLYAVTMSSLSSALQAAELRQQVYANNIANANTPGFKAQDVTFESLLQSQLSAQGNGSGVSMVANSPQDLGGSLSVGSVKPIVQTVTNTSMTSNGNNVNLDAQMSALAENQISYGALVQELNNQFTMLQTAITA